MTALRPSVLRLALAAAAAGALALPGPAGAHAWLVRAEPGDASRVSSPPHQIRLWFSETVSTRFRSAQLLGSDGRDVAGVHIRNAPHTSSTVTIDLPRLPRGTFTLVWRVLAENDGHTTSGVLLFGVGPGALPVGRGAATRAPPIVDVTLRWLRFSLVALLLGGLAFVAVLGSARARLRPELVARAERRVLTVAAGAAVLAAASQVALLSRQASSLTAAGPGGSWMATVRDLVFATHWGTLWSAQTGLLVLLVGLAFHLLRRPDGRGLAVAGVLGAGFAVADALGSHASALPAPRLPVAVDVLHLLAAAVWTGAVASFAIAVWPSRDAERRDALALAVAIRRPFAVLAGASAVAVTTTGLYAAGLEVPSVHALVASLYGQTLLAKTGVAALALALGATNFVLLQVVERTRIRRVVWQLIAAEATAGALALLAAAVLTASAPARGSPAAAPRPIVPRTLTRQVEDLVMSTTVRPNRPGANAFAVVAASTRRPAPAPIRSMQLRIGGSGRIVPLHYVPGRGWFATALLDRPGLARMTLVVRRPRLDVVAPFRWTVEQPDPSQALVPSSLRLASVVNPAALLLLVCGVLAAAVPALARQRSLHHRPRTTAEEPS